jgi:glucose/mannose-6-phosphate isomerase
MVDLDDLRVYERLDRAGMRAYLRQLPLQCRQAWEKTASMPLPAGYSDIDKVVILGMGGSAIGGEILRRLCSDRAGLMIATHRDYGLPGYVDERTLVIATSYSGTTEETLDGFSKAMVANCKRIAITTGGKLRSMAEEGQTPLVPVDYKSPPRAALGHLFVSLLGILHSLKLLPDISQEIDEMIAVLKTMSARLMEDVPLSSNQAKALSTQMAHKVPVIYGAGSLTPVAYRWKTQLNENSKCWAFAEVLPELNHNSVVGYGFPLQMKELAHVIMLYSPSLHYRHKERMKVTQELLERAGIGYALVEAEGESILAQMMGLILLGDWASYYLAILHEVDPSPVPPIDYLKQKLSSHVTR